MVAKNVLYIFDETATDRWYRYKNKEVDKLFLCPLTVNQEHISTITQRMQIGTRWDVEQVNFPKIFNEKAFSIRDEYIRFIAEFPEKNNLKEYFKLGSFSAWWFSLTAEKNTLRIDDTYRKLTKFLTILDIQKKYSCQEIWVDINDRELTHSIVSQEKVDGFTSKDLRHHNRKPDIIVALSNFIDSTVYFSKFIKRFVTTKKRMHGLSGRKKILKNSRFLLVTYFPLVDKEQLKHKKFVNKFYQPLQGPLEKKYKGRFIWLGLIADIDGFDWDASVALGRQINKWGHPFYFSEEWLTLKDLFIALMQFSYLSIKFLIKAPLLSREFKYPNTDMNIWPLFKNEWYSSFFGPRGLFNGLIFYRIFNNVFRHLKNDAIVTYIAEMYTWEKALNIAAKERKELKVVGIQHTITPLLLLNYFNHKTELRQGNNVQTMPQPNYLACVGKIPLKLFQDAGWNKNKVFVLGAIRFQHYKQHLEQEIPWNNRENKVIVALMISPEESKEVLTFVYHAFKENTEYQVIIKGHPSCPVPPLISELNIGFDEKIFKIVETPLSELLPTAKAVVVTESSSSLESIACQCPIIVPRLPNFIDMDPLSGVSDLPIYVASSKELKKIVDEIMDKKESPLAYEKCREFIESYCDFPESDEEFLRRIEELK